jgi:predicted transcriptional regulator
MIELAENARDLADLVKEERMPVDEAIAALRERQRKDRDTIEEGRRAASTGIGRFLGDAASIISANIVQGGSVILDAKDIDAVVKVIAELKKFVVKQ